MIDDASFREVTDEVEELFQMYLTMVLNFFKGDQVKAYLWWTTPNPMLGNISPMLLVFLGKGSKVLAFIDHAVKDNR